jgi:ABC-2 type transport system permease protein
MNTITAFALKELKLLGRDPGGLTMLFLLPAMFILVLSVALQGAFSSSKTGEKMRVVVVDEENGQFADLLIEGLEASGYFDVVMEQAGALLTEDEGRVLIAQGTHDVMIVVPDGATEALSFTLDKTVRVVADPAMSSEFLVAVEAAVERSAHLGSLRGFVARSGLDVEGEDLSSFVMDRGLRVAREYVSKRSEPGHPTAVQQSVPGWTIFALFWIGQILCINIISERESGAYRRILVSPTRLSHYVIGKTLPFVVINLLQAAFMFAIGVFVLPLLDCPELSLGDPLALVVLTLCTSFVSIGFGLLMAAVSRTVLFAASMSAALLVIMTVIGGIMVPKFVMPKAMQDLTLIVPQGWALDGYLDVLVRGYGLGDVLPECAGLLGFAAAFFALAVARMR